MPREGEVAVDCAKVSELLLTRCKIGSEAAVVKKLEDAGHAVTRSSVRRMLGNSRNRLYANVGIQNIENVLRFARGVLHLTAEQLGLDDVKWHSPENGEPSDPAGSAFDAIRRHSISTHREALAHRHSAFGLYGQALCPLASENNLVIKRPRCITAMDEAAKVTAPVRRGDSIQTFVRPVPMVVLGQEGVGKTWAVTQWWLARYANDLVLFLPGPIFRQAEADVARILEDALAKLIEPGRKRGEDWRRIITTNEFALAAQERVFIVVDGLNEAPDANWQLAIEAVWQTAIRWGARLVLTSRPAFWKHRARGIDHWDMPSPAEIEIEGFDRDELSRACAIAGRELDTIPVHLHEGLRNPRIFRLAVGMLPNLRSADELSIDRLLNAYWEQRLRDRPDLFRFDPDRVVLLRGLAEHAREFHERRVQVARAEQQDLAADEVAYDLDELLQRFPGLKRYGRLDGGDASLLVGEIREGRFFDADPRAPSDTYLFRKESLAFALGLFLIDELKRLRNERLHPVHLRERLSSLLEPVLDFDQTADQVMAGLTIACRDRETEIAGLLLDQFLSLRNQPYRMKPVLCGLAVQAPAVFCASAERALDVNTAEKVNSWLIAALGEMIGSGAGLATCGAWIVSPTESDASFCDGAYAPVSNVARAVARETLAAMLLMGRKVAPLAGALHQWALLMTAKPTLGRAGATDGPIGQTPIARLIRFNDQDPEALTSAILGMAPQVTTSPDDPAVVATALLLALIAEPDAVRRAEALAPGMAARADPLGDQPETAWHRAADPKTDTSALNALLSDLNRRDNPAEPDPYHPNREARRAVAARCDPGLFRYLLSGDLTKLLDGAAAEEMPPNLRAERLSWLVSEAPLAIAGHYAGDVTRVTEMLRVAADRRKYRQKGTDELEVVLETALAIAPNRAAEILSALPPEALQRNLLDGPVTHIWRPRMTAPVVIEVMAAASRMMASSTTDEVGRGLQILHLMTDFELEPTPIDAIPFACDEIFSGDEVFDDFRQTFFAIVAKCDSQGLMACLVRTNWLPRREPARPRWVDVWVLQTLLNRVPIVDIATLVDHRALPAAAGAVSDEELPILRRMIEQVIRDDNSAQMELPSPIGARRIIAGGPSWISEHLSSLTRATFRLADGFPVGINPFAAALMEEIREPLNGAADHLAAVLRLVRIRADESSRRLFRPTLAVALSEIDRRQELLDLLILGATQDKALAEIVQQAHRIGPAAVEMLLNYGGQLRSSGRTVRIAFGLALGALLGEDTAVAKGLPSGASYLRNMLCAYQDARVRNEWALHWAQQRLALRDSAAEYLALAVCSTPLPGRADGLTLPADADDLDRLFVYRFGRRADSWIGDGLFGAPKLPQWITARRADPSI